MGKKIEKNIINWVIISRKMMN